MSREKIKEILLEGCGHDASHVDFDWMLEELATLLTPPPSVNVEDLNKILDWVVSKIDSYEMFYHDEHGHEVDKVFKEELKSKLLPHLRKDSEEVK